MKEIELLKNDPTVLARRKKGVTPLARAIQAASHGKIAFTLGGLCLGDHEEKKIRGTDLKKVEAFLSKAIEVPLRPGTYPLEELLSIQAKGLSVEKALEEFTKKHLPFLSEEVISKIESKSLKIFLLGSAGTGVVSAVQDIVGAFSYAGYYGRAFPVFDPSKKGAPVSGFGIIRSEPILSHAPFEAPDIILLFDAKLFPLLRRTLTGYKHIDRKKTAILINTPHDPAEFRALADFHEPFTIYTVDADSLVRGRRIPPNYAMIGGMLGILGEEAVDKAAFSRTVRESLTAKFGPGEKVEANLAALSKAEKQIKKEKYASPMVSALGPIQKIKIPQGQEIFFEDGNRAIARAMAMVLNQFPSVVAAYPITPQTQIVEHLSQMIADGTLSAEGVTPESEHGAGGALLGAARDRVLAFTATCSQGFALMSEIIHTMAGMRMGNILISDVVRSLNSPLDVENDHGDLYKIGLDAGFVVLMSRDVQQAFDFHLMAYLVSLYAEYREVETNGSKRDPENGKLWEMIPDRALMLPAIVASEGFEVSHAPERYFGLTPAQVEKFYRDPFFDYLRTFVNTPNRSIMGALQLSNSRMDTDYQRHLAMELAHEVLKKVFEKFEKISGRRYDFIHAYNVSKAKVIFVVAGAANGTFEEVARGYHEQGVEVGVVHPNVLRPFPKAEWAQLLKGKRVFVYDRDDPYGAVGGRLYTELAGVVNEYALAASGTRLYSRIYGLGGRTPTLTLIRDEILKALKDAAGEIKLLPEKQYVGVNL